MEISVVEQKAFLLTEKITFKQAREDALRNKTSVFGSGLSNFFSRPKWEDVEITYSEKRYEPFWFIQCHGHYVYERSVKYPVKTGGSEVKSVTVDNSDYYPTDDKKHGSHTFLLPAIEHCFEDDYKEIYCNGQTGEQQDLSELIKHPHKEISLDNFTPDGIVVKPEIRASFVVRQLLQDMIKPIQADKIIEETIIIERLELYYRPLYAFEYKWTSKENAAITEFDGLSGHMSNNGKTLRQSLSEKISSDLLFDLGGDVMGLVVPGGAIAVRLTKAALDITKKNTRKSASPEPQDRTKVN